MGAAGIHTVTLEEYLANPDYKHCEYVNGEAVELNVGTGRHGRIQVRCVLRLEDYLSRNPIGFSYTELHCKLRIAGHLRYRLPDVCVILGPEIDGLFEGAPNLCVEIRSPDDSFTDQIAKFSDYFANGSQLGWLILPEEQSVLILTPGASPRVARIGDSLDGGEILPGLHVPVTGLFA